MSLPWSDWQFWTVSIAAVGSVWMLVRPFLSSGSSERPACPHCATGGSSPCSTPVVSIADRRRPTGS